MNSISNQTKTIKPFNFINQLREKHAVNRSHRWVCFQRKHASAPATPSVPLRTWDSALCVPARLGAFLIMLVGLVGIVPHVAAADPLSPWITRTAPTNVTMNAVTFANGKFVAVAPGWALTSPDGTTWTASTNGLNNKAMYGVAFGNNTFVSIGASGKAHTSPDGVTWTLRDTGTSANFNSLRYANNLFLAAGDGGAIYTSPNGITWTPHNTASSNYWQDITFANGQYVAIGYNYYGGAARRGVTSNLLSWDIADTGYFRYLDAVEFIGGRYHAVGYAGMFQSSTNGLQWTTATNINTSWMFDLAYGNGWFVAVGESGSICASPNGFNWTNRLTSTSKSLNSVAFGNNTFVAIGQTGTILQSDPAQGPVAGSVTLSQAARVGNNFSFQFNGTVGQTYQVQASTNLINWTTLTNLLCTNVTTGCSLGGQTMPKRFYRVVKP